LTQLLTPGPGAFVASVISRAGSPALSNVISGPEWLKIRVVKCEASLFEISQIERGKWSNVIDVPELPILP